MKALTDAQLLRYARNVLLPEIDIKGQQILLASHLVVVGAGGLGSPVLQYCAAMGIGTITVIDPDCVDETNLQRQVIYQLSQIGLSKVEAAAQFISQLNPEVTVVTHHLPLDRTSVDECLSGADIVVIGTDNYLSRQITNDYCFHRKIPLVVGAAIGSSGQVTSFNYADASQGCYQCVYPEQTGKEVFSCANSGVFGPVVGTVGSIMAMEVVKILTNTGQPLYGRLLIWDANAMSWQTFTYQQNSQCSVCAKDNV